MRTSLICLCIGIALCLASEKGLAQIGSSTEARIQKSLKNPPKKVFYDFEEVDILGNIKKPLGSSLLQSPEIRFKQLLNLDESFVPKIIDSIDEY
jgi:hypothetical protein